MAITTTVPLLVNAAAMFALTVMKLFKTLKHDVKRRRIKEYHPLLRVLFEESLIYSSG